MPAARRATKKPIVVVLDKCEVKKHSRRFLTDDPSAAITNLYLKNADWESLGRPDTLKVTIQPG